MKISIVTSTYNDEKTIGKLYESILDQDVYEWIIVDDGSTDSTWKKIKRIVNENKLKVEGLTHVKKGSRYTTNLNNGLRKVKGDVVFIVNGDSWLAPNTIENIKEYFIDNSAGSALREYYLDNKFQGYDWRFKATDEERERVTNKPYWWCFLTGNGAIVQSKHLEMIDYLDEGYTGYGLDDWDLFLRLGVAGVDLYKYNKVRVRTEASDDIPNNFNNVKRFNKKLVKLFGEEKLLKWQSLPDYKYKYGQTN